MNKIFRFFVFTAIAVSSFSFASCGSDDDDENDAASTVIEGSPTTPEQVSGNSWVLNYSKSSAYQEMNGVKGPAEMSASEANGVIPTTMTFYSDGQADIDVSGKPSKGSYSISGKEFSCTYDVYMDKTDYSGETSMVAKRFTLEKNADLSALIYDELGFGDDANVMQQIFTQCEITQLGEQLILNLTLTTNMNVGEFDGSGFDDELSKKYENLFNNIVKSKKYISFHLVYDKK